MQITKNLLSVIFFLIKNFLISIHNFSKFSRLSWMVNIYILLELKRDYFISAPKTFHFFFIFNASFLSCNTFRSISLTPSFSLLLFYFLIWHLINVKVFFLLYYFIFLKTHQKRKRGEIWRKVEGLGGVDIRKHKWKFHLRCQCEQGEKF